MQEHTYRRWALPLLFLVLAGVPFVAQWLGEALGPCSDWQQKGQTFKCKAGDVPVTWLPKAVGKWHSLLLESDSSPWATDRDCAEAACAALGVEVRCAIGGWSEDESDEAADRWLRVTSEGVSEITWRTA